MSVAISHFPFEQPWQRGWQAEQVIVKALAIFWCSDIAEQREREDPRQHCTVSVIVCNQCYVQMTTWTSHGTGNDGWRLAGSSVAEMIWRLIIQAQITFILPVSRYRKKYWHKNNTLQCISTYLEYWYIDGSTFQTKWMYFRNNVSKSFG